MVKRIRRNPDYLIKKKEYEKIRYERNKIEIIKHNSKYRVDKQLDENYRLQRLLTAAKTRAKNKDLKCDIDFEHLLYLWNSQSGCCAISGRKFDLSSATERVNKNTISLDRIDSNKGYTRDNVRLVTWQVNCAISEYGFDSFIEICQDVINFNRG